MIRFLNKYSDRFVSKWLVLAMDIFIISASFFIATLLINNFNFNYFDPGLFKYHLAIVVLLRVTAFLYFNSNTGIIRHASLEDGKLIFKTILFSSLELVMLRAIPENNFSKFYSLPFSIIFIDFFISSFGLFFSRILVKTLYEKLINNFKSKKKVIIYGAGHLGRITRNTLIKDKKRHHDILCFIDDNLSLVGKTIEGTLVLTYNQAINKFLGADKPLRNEIEVIFAIQTISTSRKSKILDNFLEDSITPKIVPPIKSWINNELNINEIKNIKIEDLLDRDPIELNNKLVAETIKDSVVLITGAAGSIGSEIVRQTLLFKPSKVILIDQAESGLYDLETEISRLTKKNCEIDIILEVADVTNFGQIDTLFKEHKPHLVFHAAAYKHVPLMEKSPYNSINVNVKGTKNLADISNKYHVQKFVFISTDKAVNPTNVMGATKRVAEMYVQSLNSLAETNTRFIVTRFGNVLGSNGSVIPLFKKQIEKGGPVTVTHPDIDRYFMTIPEACQLVLEAGIMGKGGEVFVFDMGEPVKIVDLAKKMIKLSGFNLGSDMEIEFTGLRPGEKLYEELLASSEDTLNTYNPKILIAKINTEDFKTLNLKVSELILNLNNFSNMKMVNDLKSIVLEYKSENSEFESLDTFKV